jgi:hypothetical protein
MEELRASGSAAKDAFMKVFGCDYKSSTYSDNVYVWKNAPAQAMTSTVGSGHTKDGEWSKLLKVYRKNSQRRK